MTKNNIKTSNSFLEGPVLPSLLRFSIPILMALFLQALYGAVDMWAVGTFCGPSDLSAVATGSQTLMIATSFLTGLSMGTTILLGQKTGEGNGKDSAKALGSSLVIFGILSIFITALLILLAPGIASSMNAPASAYEKTVSYIRICGGGIFFITGYNLLSSVFRGLGNSNAPFVFVLIACIFNIILDVTFIKYFHMGTAGAAFATVLAQSISVIIALVYIRKEGLPFEFGLKDIRYSRNMGRLVLKLGSPIAFQDMFTELSYLMLMGFVNYLGVNVSAGVGVAEKLVMFIVLIPRAHLQSISAFVAQNRGGGRMDRAKEALFKGMASSVFLGGIAALVSYFEGPFLASVFTSDPEVIRNAAEYLQATAIECFVLSFAFCFTGYFNGLGKTLWVMIQGLTATFLIRIPVAFYESRRPDPQLFRIGFSAVDAAVFMLVSGIIYYIIIRKKDHSIKGIA